MEKLLILSCMFLCAVPALGELRDENLLQNLPAGYNVGHQQRQGNMLMIEMVPNGQIVQDWSEMLTTQIFFGNLNVAPLQSYQNL